VDTSKLIELWKKDEEMSFKGWDFAYIRDRWEEESLPWDYSDIIMSYLKPNYKLLDMGTGGGEFLLSLNHPYNNTSVTEAWEPNFKLCKEKLEPLGICVRQLVDDITLPFEDNSFDIVINRHESYDAREISRVLRPNGIFITQQVGGRNNEILSKRLIKNFISLYNYLTLDYSVEYLKLNSFEIIYQNEYYPYLHFFDIGAIVFFAKIIEWEFPGFSVDSCFDELYRMQEELHTKPYIESIEHRYIIVSKNKK